MNTIKPRPLQKGDTIAFISPASKPADMNRIVLAKTRFESFGYKVKLGSNLSKERGYLAGTDDERIEDITAMFGDPEVNAILCVRGGYGSGRLLDRLPYDLIKANPKIFCGYSDITAMHNAIYAKTGLVTFAGPMAAVDWYNTPDEYSAKVFFDLLANPHENYTYQYPAGHEVISKHGGKASGKLFGGNLALVLSILGTPYLPDLDGCILYLEDVGEEPYRVDRMLNQLRLAGIFDKMSGLIIGQFTDCEVDHSVKKSITLDEVFSDYLTPIKKPVLFNFPHGHVTQNATLPHGVEVLLDADALKVTLMEALVL